MRRKKERSLTNVTEARRNINSKWKGKRECEREEKKNRMTDRQIDRQKRKTERQNSFEMCRSGTKEVQRARKTIIIFGPFLIITVIREWALHYFSINKLIQWTCKSVIKVKCAKLLLSSSSQTLDSQASFRSRLWVGTSDCISAIIIEFATAVTSSSFATLLIKLIAMSRYVRQL